MAFEDEPLSCSSDDDDDNDDGTVACSPTPELALDDMLGARAGADLRRQVPVVGVDLTFDAGRGGLKVGALRLGKELDVSGMLVCCPKSVVSLLMGNLTIRKFHFKMPSLDGQKFLIFVEKHPVQAGKSMTAYSERTPYTFIH